MGFLDKIKNLINKRADVDVNYLSLILTPSEVLAAIWHLELEKVKIIGFGQKRFENIDSLVHQAAVAIDKAGQNAQSDVAKVVFGLSHFWLKDSQPTDETSKILEQLSKELELQPQAFIPIPSAISLLLKIEEEEIPNAVLVGTFNNYCEAHLLESNKVVATKIVPTAPDLEKISNLLTQLKVNDKALPPRIIVYPRSNESLIAKIKNHDWQGLFSIKPKIETLSDQELTKAVAYAQAADILGHEPLLAAAQSDMPTESGETAETGEDFGFVEGEDILQKAKTKPQPTEKPRPIETIETSNDYALDLTTQEENVGSLSPQSRSVSRTNGILSKLGSLFRFKFSPKKIGIGLIILAAILLLGSFVAAQFLTSAEVVIKVNAQEVENSFKADVVLGSNVDGDSEIQGQEVSATSQGSQKAVVTGSKKLGDKAKGAVKILNWDKQPKTFSSGAEILTKDGLKFTLDEEVKVASRSATTPGENKSNATASDFGSQYNIASGVDFTIVGFDEIFYSAVSESSFTGGSERQSTVVSEGDLDRLEKSLTDTQVEKAKTNLREKAGSKKVHDEAIVIKVLKKDFDKKVNEEASLVNLDMEVEANAIVYEEPNLLAYLTKSAQKDVSSNQQVRPEDIEIIDVAARRLKDGLTLSGKFKASLIPKFNEDDIREKIAGKGEKEIREILKALPDVQDIQIKFTPNLPIGQSLPRNKSKIKFLIEAI